MLSTWSYLICHRKLARDLQPLRERTEERFLPNRTNKVERILFDRVL